MNIRFVCAQDAQDACTSGKITDLQASLVVEAFAKEPAPWFVTVDIVKVQVFFTSHPNDCEVCHSFASNSDQTPVEASGDCYIHQYWTE